MRYLYVYICTCILYILSCSLNYTACVKAYRARQLIQNTVSMIKHAVDLHQCGRKDSLRLDVGAMFLPVATCSCVSVLCCSILGCHIDPESLTRARIRKPGAFFIVWWQRKKLLQRLWKRGSKVHGVSMICESNCCCCFVAWGAACEQVVSVAPSWFWSLLRSALLKELHKT